MATTCCSFSASGFSHSTCFAGVEERDRVRRAVGLEVGAVHDVDVDVGVDGEVLVPAAPAGIAKRWPNSSAVQRP
jgi:hypothetical protein